MHLFQHKNKKQFWLTLLVGYLVIAFCALLPILIAITAGAIAESHGCRADEAGSYPCVIGGIDFGEMISLMGVFGWFSMISVPLGFVEIIAWTVKSISALKFNKQGTRYALADFKNLTTKGYGQVEAMVWHFNHEKTISIFFEDPKQWQRFTQKKGTMIEGVLQENNGQLTLSKTRVY